MNTSIAGIARSDQDTRFSRQNRPVSPDWHRRLGCSLGGLIFCFAALGLTPADETTWPRNLKVVIDNTEPLKTPRRGRLPLFVLPINNSLASLSDDDADAALRQLDQRGIGYTVDWSPSSFESSLAEGLRIATLQQAIGQPVSVNANACLYSFFDGSEKTLHVGVSGERFAETSFGGTIGCPFSLEHRVPVIKERIEKFLREYKKAGLEIDFIFADWEIDGPIEWNDAWSTCRKCTRCCEEIPNIDDFREFQSRLRKIRSEIQRVAFGDNVTAYFPEALVGNYGTYPHGGHRYWYDYFEEDAKGVPVLRDQRAPYREWAHEFERTGYTFAMPVVYTWYRLFNWYDYEELDYRWFYNMLLVASNAGQHTAHTTPIIPFVHWTTTAPPKEVDPDVKQFSKAKYQELLWHLLLRGHDTFFLWCVSSELEDEIRLVHEVYADSQQYAGFLTRGTPITFDVSKKMQDVVSGLRLGDRVLVRRTSFGRKTKEPIAVAMGDGCQIKVESDEGLVVVPIESPQIRSGLIQRNGEPLFPIGFYELPGTEEDLQEMAAAGVNLVRCGNKADLDRAQAAGVMGWISLSVQQGRTDSLRKQIESVADHPALALWEGPDEIIWTFTAYSFLKDRAGFTRDDWNDQKKIAVDYSEEHGAKIMSGLREGIELVRELDKRNLQFWINEAADSDVRFARQYMPSIDITGCDYYAVRSAGTDLQSIGRLVDRWDSIGRGKPVWMVLQAFSWHSAKPERGRLYPTFDQSRFMAYDAIVHGSKGVLYWGSNVIDDPKFRQSLYALTAELSALQPFLTGDVIDGATANVIDDLFDPPGRGVRTRLFRHATDYLLLLVNEDDHRHLGVDIAGLKAASGREFSLLYGEETATVSEGSVVTRMQPFEVKVFATNKRRYETTRRGDRSYK